MAEDVLTRIYNHIADRVAQHYHLPLTPQMWADWNAAIHHRTPEAMFVCLRLSDTSVWRVRHGSTPVFVLYRDGLIRTALELSGSYHLDATEEARKIGQTGLGAPLHVPSRPSRDEQDHKATQLSLLRHKEKQAWLAGAEDRRQRHEQLTLRLEQEKFDKSRWEDDGGSVNLVAHLRYRPHRFLNEKDELINPNKRLARMQDQARDAARMHRR